MSRVLSAALLGIDGVPVEVEVGVGSQLPRIEIVGLPEAAVRESAARVRAAIAAVGHRIPDRRVTVNLAPASLRKSGAGLDLPIAVGILAASGALDASALEGLALFGELALDGRLRPVRGALALALAVRDRGCRELIVAEPDAREAALAPGLVVRGAPGLAAVLGHLMGAERLGRAVMADAAPLRAPGPDLAEVRGQERAKRALEIAAAGEHAALLRGPPGAGKTMLARRLPGVLPPLDFEEAIEVTRVHGAAGRLGEGPVLVRERPFRAPHHTASGAGLLGGGNPPRPGEVSLAHRGVLFLDELPEFDRRCLESLRQVLEERRVLVARAGVSCAFPADFQLVAAANPCPCGWRGTPGRDCRCDDGAVARYLARVSGPLLDRIDLHVSVQPVPWTELDAEVGPESSSGSARARIAAARQLQERRARRHGLSARSNAHLSDAELEEGIQASADARRILGRAVDRFGLSARAARRVLKVARTIADLAGERSTDGPAIAEALGFRSDVA